MANKPFVNNTVLVKCKCKTNRNYIAPVSCGDDDDAAVAVLPDDWIPNHSGPILTNYLMQREQDHEEIIKYITKRTIAIDESINGRVRALAENLLALIKQNQHDMDCIIQKFEVVDLFITKEMRNDVLKEIKKLQERRVDDIFAFKGDALALERQRADRLKALLLDNFKRLIAISHKTPKDILDYFDQHIYQVNEQILSNSRAYDELERQLRVQADESVLRARLTLNQLCLGVGRLSRNHSVILKNKGERSLKPRSVSADGLRNVSNLSGILNDVEEFKTMISCLANAYRTAVLNIFNEFSMKLSELEKGLYSQQDIHITNKINVSNISDLHNIIEMTVSRLSVYNNNISKGIQSEDYSEKTGADIFNLQNSLRPLGKCLLDIFTILYNAGHFWDAHILRSALAQKLTLSAVEDLITINDSIVLLHEVPFNIALERMRSSSDINLLQFEFDSIKIMLDRISQMYLEHSRTELGRLEEYMKLPILMANTLLSELNLLLEDHSRSTILSFNSGNSERVLPTNHLPHLPLSEAILQTELQEAALKNWRNGFLESFENNVSLVPEELRKQARVWIEEKGTALQMRYSLKMVSHSIRMERVKAARDMRLAELNFHKARLESHLEVIYDLVDRMPREAAEFAAVDAPFLYPLFKWKERIETVIKIIFTQYPVNHESIKFKLHSYIIHLQRHRHLFEQSLDEAILVHKNLIAYRVQEALIANVRFVSQVRLFSEGGRYGAMEGLRTCSLLVEGSEALESAENRALIALTRRRGQLLNFVDTELIPLRHLLGIDAGRKRKESKSKSTKKRR